MNRAATSFTTAVASENLAMGVWRIPRLSINFTATGRAVIEMHKPKNIMRMMSWSYAAATNTPPTNGSRKLVRASSMPRPFKALNMSEKRISRPAFKMMRKTASSVTPANALLGSIKPSSAGPSNTPARISPISSGWL